MKYSVFGTMMPMLEMTLDRGETVVSQTGAMKYMDRTIDMNTRMTGGVGGFLKRAFMQESGFLSYFTSRQEKSRIAFGHTFPGTIIPVDVTSRSLICQKRAFLCSEQSVELELYFQKKLGTAFFGGEGFVMQQLKGTGTAFVEIDGEVKQLELDRGKSIQVETGAVAMFTETVTMDVEMIKGAGNILFGGEGIFLTTLTGPGTVWLQTLSIQSLAREVFPFLPAQKSR